MARDEVDLLSLQREDFRKFLDARPQVAMRLLSALSRLVRRVTQLVHDTTFLDARTRLVRVLLELAENQGRPGTEGVVIAQKLTQSELANLCGLTRESTNKWLRFYVREGLLSYEGGRITPGQNPSGSARRRNSMATASEDAGPRCRVLTLDGGPSAPW